MSNNEPYLVRLANRLASGLAGMDDDRRARHRAYVASFQMDDGGFRGREGDSDLYYTGFAARALAVLDAMTDDVREPLGRFVAAQTQSRLSVIDLVSWLYTGLVVQTTGGEDPFAAAGDDWVERISETLESVRTDDGGYAKTTEGAAGSMYHSFLVALTYELLGRRVPRPNRLIQFIYDRQRDDGGFVEISPMKRSGTNPTAAAVAMLVMFDAMDGELREDVREFLTSVRSAEGGFQANSRIPFADGLSTFTGLLTAQDLDLGDLLKPAQVEHFVSTELEFPTGGFRGASWDEAADVEYTFYGLGVLGLLGVQQPGDEGV